MAATKKSEWKNVDLIFGARCCCFWSCLFQRRRRRQRQKRRRRRRSILSHTASMPIPIFIPHSRLRFRFQAPFPAACDHRGSSATVPFARCPLFPAGTTSKLMIVKWRLCILYLLLGIPHTQTNTRTHEHMGRNTGAPAQKLFIKVCNPQFDNSKAFYCSNPPPRRKAKTQRH